MKDSSRKQNKIILQTESEEDYSVDRVDRMILAEEFSHELREALKKKVSLKELKKLAGDIRFKHIITEFTAALETGDTKKAEMYGTKIEEYCISKPKQGVGDVGKGADMLMEVVARALSGQVPAPQITEGEIEEI